jgi:hypothetical protein
MGIIDQVMPDISKSYLEHVKARLESVNKREIPEAKWQATDWQVVKSHLLRLDNALDEKNESLINETVATLLTRLGYEKQVFRGEIGAEPEDKTQPMPEPVWELLNHIVGKIDYVIKSSQDEYNSH